jgi:hypothetical protein
MDLKKMIDKKIIGKGLGSNILFEETTYSNYLIKDLISIINETDFDELREILTNDNELQVSLEQVRPDLRQAIGKRILKDLDRESFWLPVAILQHLLKSRHVESSDVTGFGCEEVEFKINVENCVEQVLGDVIEDAVFSALTEYLSLFVEERLNVYELLKKEL